MDLVERLRSIDRAGRIGERADLIGCRAAASELERLRASVQRVRDLCAGHQHVCSCAQSEALLLPSQVLAALDGADA